MDYASVAELRRRTGRSVFDEIYGKSELPDFSDLSIALDDLLAAAAEIDGAIAARYRLPVTGERSLALLKDWCLTLAEERAFARPAGESFTEKVKTRVAQVRQYLDKIRDDAFRLPDAEENRSGTGAGGVAIVQCDEPVFGRDRMKGF